MTVTLGFTEKYRSGTSPVQADYAVPEGIGTVEAVVDSFIQSWAGLRDHLCAEGLYSEEGELVAVYILNNSIVPKATPVSDGDTIRLIYPAIGG